MKLALIHSLFLVTILMTPIVGGVTHAAYEPGASILMTGSTVGNGQVGMVRFDIASYAFDGYSYLTPKLDTSTRSFSGGFYTDRLGWFVLEYESQPVLLDCEAQPLDNLTNPCLLTGFGWGENIGPLEFSSPNARVEYLPNSGTLSGSAWSTAIGAVRLDGIILPLLPAGFDLSTPLRADHLGALSVSGSVLYGDSARGWSVYVSPLNAPSYFSASSDLRGEFRDIDLSMAGTYGYELIDPSGSKTTGILRVFPDTVAYSIFPGSTSLGNYCLAEPTRLPSICPDGPDIRSTYLTGGLGTWTDTGALADSIDTMEIEFALRDKYGNAIFSDTDTRLELQFDIENTLGSCQIGIENANICEEGLPGDAGLFGGDFSGPINYLNLEGNWHATNAVINPKFALSSYAPSSAEHKIQFRSIKYRYETTKGEALDPAMEITGVYTQPLQFTPPFTLTGVTVDQIMVGRITTIAGELLRDAITAPFTAARVIQSLSVGDGLLANSDAEYKAEDAWDCRASFSSGGYDGDCAWGTGLRGRSRPSLGAGELISGSFTHAWRLDSRLASTTEPVYLTPVYTYMLGGEVIAYYGEDISLKELVPPPPPIVKILGVMGQIDSASYAGPKISTVLDSSVDLRNTLRKNIMTLWRERTNYDDTDYIVVIGSDYTVTRTFAGGKRSILVIGGDVIISEDLMSTPNYPRAIVALTDAFGKGGNILVGKSVKNIDASLFADRGLISGEKSGTDILYYSTDAKQNQLYIHGIVLTQNTLGGAAIGKCPPLIESCAPTDYDFTYLRDGYILHDESTRVPYMSSGIAANTFSGSAVIIEYDARLLANPPRGFEK